MISNIVDSSGFLAYKGDDVDAKFATVLAISGHSRVEGDTGNFKKPKWDGSEWVEGHVPDYIENRLNEYPTIAELTIALYDTDDKAAIEKRRSDVKAKYPKPE